MPSGGMPSYNFRPVPGGQPQIPSRSARRSRLWAGGTYFRSRDVGIDKNKISVQVFEYTSEVPGEVGELKGKCIITNYNEVFSENVLGKASAIILDMQMKWNSSIRIINLNSSPSAWEYSISSKIAPDAQPVSEIGPFSFSTLFQVPGKLSVKLMKTTQYFTPSDEIIIQPRYRMYDLVRTSKTETSTTPGENPGDPPVETSTTTEGWDIADLRAKINASDPWVEMVSRSSGSGHSGGISFGGLGNHDVQDHGSDDDFLTPFQEARLYGADGLPATPTGIVTGPERALVHLNYSEMQNGALGAANQIYEWAGDTAFSGEWRLY